MKCDITTYGIKERKYTFSGYEVLQALCEKHKIDISSATVDGYDFLMDEEEVYLGIRYIQKDNYEE